MKAHSVPRILLYGLLAILSVNALGAGLLFMIRPDGSLLQIPLDSLSRSPFRSFLWPGIFLFIFIGILSLLSFYYLFRGPMVRSRLAIINLYPTMNLGWTLAVYAGFSVICWITIQQLWLDYFWLQTLILVIGILILICALWPTTMSYYKIEKDSK